MSHFNCFLCRSSPLFLMLLLALALFIAPSNCRKVVITRVVDVSLRDPYINGVRYRGLMLTRKDFRGSWRLCRRLDDPSCSWSCSSSSEECDVRPPGRPRRRNCEGRCPRRTRRVPRVVLVPRNFLNPAETLCRPRYCVLVYGERTSMKLKVVGFENQNSFNLTMPVPTFRHLFCGNGASPVVAVWRFVDCGDD